MERAEFATGTVEVRGSSAIHRLLSFLGAFFLGIGQTVPREEESGNWWDREELHAPETESPPLTLGRQAELFDDAGHATFTAAPGIAEPAAPSPVAAPKAAPRARSIPQTVVSVHSRSRSSARVVATTRAASSTRVSAVPRTAQTARGAVARQLVMSQSISSGREESRWFSVPQRVLLPRFQLFEGADAVSEDSGGALRIGSRSPNRSRGQVWFV